MKNEYENWSKEDLLNEIKKLKKRKKYGLVWVDKTEDVVSLCQNNLPILLETKSKNISTSSELPTNVIIEGDNYHALSVLNYTHRSKINVIYIDPPYNTGNGDDFTYNDSRVDKEDPYKHSKWISFMHKRLKLAKNLLAEDGLIFISINDAEVGNLRLLCDEIFGETCFVSQLIWKSRQNVDSRSLTGVSSDHEYILTYRKGDFAKLRGKDIKKSKYKNPDNDPRGPWMSSPMDGVATKERRPNLHYTIVNPETGLKYDPSPENGWRFQRSTVETLINEDRIIWPKNPRSKPRFKRYLNELKSLHTGFSSILEADFTSHGTKEVRNILGKEAFKFPKPVNLIEQLVEQHPNKNALVLDFFAGSGTTGHATIQLNNRDGGKRKFILCTNNENDIAEKVCYQRIKKVIEGFVQGKDKIKGFGGNLRYYKTDFIDSAKTDANRALLTQKAVDMLCIKEEAFEAISDNKNLKIFENREKFLAVLLNTEDIDELKKEIEKLHKPVNVYIFSLSNDLYEEQFKEFGEQVTLSPIPEAIYKVYKRIFK